MRALAMESMEDGSEKTDPRLRRMLEGVGTVGGNLECNVADKSSKTAAGVVSGR